MHDLKIKSRAIYFICYHKWKTLKLIFLTFMCGFDGPQNRLSVRIRQIRQLCIVFDVHHR